jgi:PAS domain S-box-containing protein
MIPATPDTSTRRVVLAVAALALAAAIAGLDWLLPSVQLAYLEVVPVLLVAVGFGPRAGVAAAIVVSVPVMYLEYLGAFRESQSNLPVNVAILVLVLVLVTLVFDRFLKSGVKAAVADAELKAARERERSLASSEERYRLLGESIPGTTWTADKNGLLDHISVGSAEHIDGPPESRLADAWLQIVHPDDRERVRAHWAACVASGDPYDIQFRVLMEGGSYRWQLVRALPQRDDDGDIVRWVGMNVDIDDQRRADEERDKFVALAENSGNFVAIVDVAGKLTYANPAARRVLALDDARSPNFIEWFPPEDREFVRSTIFPAIESDGRWTGNFQFRNFETGKLVPILFNAFAMKDAGGERMGIATISQDLRERQWLDIGMRALVEAGTAMYSSLEYQETLNNVARAVTASFATFCTIDIIADDGTFRRVACAHPDPEIAALLETYADERRPASRHPIGRALLRGQSTVVTDVNELLSGEPESSTERAERLGLRSLICVPVRAPEGEVIGALTCCLDRDANRPAFTEHDVVFAEELGRRAGIAMQHARAYEHERTIAVRFQEASLPASLPKLPDVRLSADYRPGRSDATVGGDWYDAFLLSDGRVAITIGDVVGKGLDAAVTMAQLRQSMHSAASLVPEPNAMLTAAERTIRDISADAFATALAGIYDPRDRRLSFATAGHPGPFLRRADGAIEEFAFPGAMLGLRTNHTSDPITVATPPGSALVFFTDGLTELTRDLDEGFARVRAALSELDEPALENPAKSLIERVLNGEHPRDDIAVLVAQIGPSPAAP